MVNSRRLLNIFLLTFAVILVGLVFIGDDNQLQMPRPKITSLNHQDINRLVIQAFGEDPTKLVKTNDQWRITSPLNLPANNVRINTTLRLVESISMSQFPAVNKNIDQYGLTNPMLVVTVNDLVLQFGNTDPIHNYRYVLVDNAIHLFSDQFSHFLQAKPTYFVSNALLPGNSAIEEIKLPELNLTKHDGRWKLNPPTDIQISQDILHTLIDEWRFAQALKVEKYSADKISQADTITLKLTGNDKPVTFHKFSADDELILARPDWGIQYHFVSSQEKQLFALPQAENQ